MSLRLLKRRFYKLHDRRIILASILDRKDKNYHKSSSIFSRAAWKCAVQRYNKVLVPKNAQKGFLASADTL